MIIIRKHAGTLSRNALSLLLLVACCGVALAATNEQHHLSRRTVHARRLEAGSSSSEGAADGGNSAVAAKLPGRRWLAASASPPAYEYWELPPEEDIRVPAQSMTQYDTSQAVVFQITQHFDDLAAELGLEDGGKAPATGGEGDIPPVTGPAWSDMDTTLRVVEGSVSRPSCVMPGAVISGIIWPVYGQLQIGCNSSLSYSLIAPACLGQRSCAVFASNGVFGDPCPGTPKSLTFTYRCSSPTATPAFSSPPGMLSPSPPPPSPMPSPMPSPPPSPAPSLPPPPPSPDMIFNTLPAQPRLTTPISPNPPALDVSFPPTMFLPAPPALPAGCPGGQSGNVASYGARGDSYANDAAALLRANAAPGGGMLYFPVGVYRISSSLTLTKPVLMGANTRFLVDKGVTLRLMAQPRRAPLRGDPLFAGAGKVVFGTAGLEVFPQWWLGPDRSQAVALQAAADSCELPCTLLQTTAFNLDRGVAFNPRNGFFATAKALIVGAGGSGEGISLLPGSYTMPLSFSGILNFAQWGLRLLPGVRDVNIQSGLLTNNVNGLVLSASPTQPLTNVTISHISVAQNNQFTTVFSSVGDNSVFQDVTVRVNFELMGGSRQPNSPAAGTVFRGGAPTLRNTRMVVQAMDPAQFLVVTKWVAVRTETAKPVSNFLFRSDCWNGGFEKSGALVEGAFRNSYFMVYTSGSMNGRIFVFSSSSNNNTLSMGNNAAGGEWPLATTLNTPNAFNGGKPVVEQGLWVSTRTTKDWLPNEQRTFYLFTYFAQAANPKTNMQCISWAGWNPGVSCDSVQRALTSAAGGNNQISLTLTNRSNKIIPPGFYHRFGVQVAP